MIGNLLNSLILACCSASLAITGYVASDLHDAIHSTGEIINNKGYSYYYQADVNSLGWFSYNMGQDSSVVVYDYDAGSLSNQWNLYAFDSSGAEVSTTFLSTIANMPTTFSNLDLKFGMYYRLYHNSHVSPSYLFEYHFFWDYSPVMQYDSSGNLINSFIPNKCEFLTFLVHDRNGTLVLPILCYSSYWGVNTILNNNINSNLWYCFGTQLPVDVSSISPYYVGRDFYFAVDLDDDTSAFDSISEGDMPFYSFDFQVQFFEFNDVGESSDYWYNLGKETGYNTGYQTGYSTGYQTGYSEGLSLADNSSFMSLFNGIADTPLRFIYGLFNFDLFGVNVLIVILSLLTFIFVFHIIKKVWK